MKIPTKLRSKAVIAAISLFCSAFHLMAVNMYLYFPGVPGDSVASGYQKLIEVASFSGGVSIPVTVTNTGAIIGKPAFSDIVMTKYLDSASTPLYLFCAQGGLAKGVTLTMTQVTGTSETAFYKVTIGTCVIKSIQTTVSGGVPGETLVLTPIDSVQWSFTPMNSNGTLGTPIVHTYNIQTGTGS